MNRAMVMFSTAIHSLLQLSQKTLHMFKLITTAHQNSSFLSPFTIIIKGSSRLKPVLRKINAFWLHLFYIISLSLIGFILIRALPMKDPSIQKPDHLDLVFMSISANTVSSMSSVEIESFSNSQLTVFILLMFLGGEVFTSMLKLILHHLNIYYSKSTTNLGQDQESELGFARPEKAMLMEEFTPPIKQSSSKYLICVVMMYLLLIHSSGYILIKFYLRLFPDSRAVLQRKGIHEDMFAVFTVVSSFANCGFLPTNESLMDFKTSSGFLLIVGCLVLLGNTMYPIGLRLMVWALMKITKRKELEFILNDKMNCLGYDNHLMSGELETGMLGVTVSGFIMMQTMLFLALEWSSEGLKGMNGYQKVVGSWFISVNSRHSGESIVDLSAVSLAVLALIVVMMYLPPYTTFLPMTWRGGEDGKKKDKKTKGFIENVIVSQLSYLATFIIIICITERANISKDPLNFSGFNIVVEVISAYGNVGYTAGYSCKRRLKLDGECNDSWVGFSGKWSSTGKITLMLVMIFGRLKRYNMKGGKAWMIR